MGTSRYYNAGHQNGKTLVSRAGLRKAQPYAKDKLQEVMKERYPDKTTVQYWQGFYDAVTEEED